MCGINGIHAFHYAANPVDRSELIRTRDHMAPRGPDGAEAWFSEDGRVALGHRRLSIIDLSDAGTQPMASSDGRLVVTFNGEIYNFRALRADLEAKGHVFVSQSDTEVLLHLYASRGEAMVHDLRGMFAFAIWDSTRQVLFLARDPYGIKPLYYADDGWTFRFASQVKALLAGGAISRDPDPAGQVGFYLWGSVPEPFTTCEAIRALPAGCTLTVDRIGAREPRRYHSIAAVYREADALRLPRHDASDVRAELRDALADSVRHHLVADVPVGAFLSAGIDSGALVGLMRSVGQQSIQTVTLAFEEFRGRPEDESLLAAGVARAFETQHTTRVVTQAEFEADLPRILDAMDQPTIDGINTWFVAKAARELGLKVAISGLGGDELFGGYPSFRDIPRWVKLLAVPSHVPGFGRVARRLSQPLVSAVGFSPKVPGLLEYGGTYAGAYLVRRGLFMPWELRQLLDPDVVHRGLRRLAPLARVEAELPPAPASAHAKVASLESSLYMRNQLLRDTDWASMAHSLEVRVPLVDSALLQTVATARAAAPAQVGKELLAESPNVPLPTAIRERAKTGFTTPIGRWIRDARLGAAARRERGLLENAHWSRQWAERLAAI
ncbi:asparagine synthase (glutamine-hydrolyzing) [Hyphomicrobium sp. CS1BSMeth3]|uniref:asparagine synthase (glutamine-hydrolyzing) n=1 Tax=Hyphomicrobium sp. CS1BSMeth3 TaxID=1892844 RepID=UPI00093007EF|nr:asparagine synthase (glutamine-hydrolyzing) [Hyphomicrobium sp. CS1BSMeth3]